MFPCGTDKKPLTKRGFKDATTDEKTIRQWWTQYPRALVGVPTGAISGLLVIDVDPDGLDFVLQRGDLLDVGRRHNTRRGFHYLFRAPRDVSVRCSAGKVAEGVDVRADGGYIIWWPATGLKAYGPDIHELPAAPAQLLDLLVKSSSRDVPQPLSTTPSRTTTHEDLHQLERALDRRDADCGYDDWVRIGMALHHASGGSENGFHIWNDWSARGETKYRGVDDVRKHWDSFSSAPGKNVVTARSILRDDVASPDEFENEDAESKQRFALVADHEFVARAPLAWHIKGVLPKAELVVVYGQSGSGKSFLVFDMVAAIAQGTPWQDRRTAKGRVVVVVAEGASGFRNRLLAHAKMHGHFPGARVTADAPNLLAERDHVLLAQKIEAAGGADLVVIDTLAASSPGADENAAKDMGKVIEHCKRLHKATGATVLLIHHSGKDESKGARGWSGLRAAADAEIEISRNGGDRMATVTKLKDGEDGAKFAFKLVPVEIGADADGELITSCIVEPVAVVPSGHRKEPQPGSKERTLLDAIRNALSIDGRVTTASVIETVVKQLPKPDGRDTRKQHFTRALQALASKGFITIEGDTCRAL